MYVCKLNENCELRGTDNAQGQISEHIFAPNGDYCLYYPSNLFRNARSFKNWGIFNNYPAKSRGISSDQTIFREIDQDNCFIIQQIDNKTA